MTPAASTDQIGQMDVTVKSDGAPISQAFNLMSARAELRLNAPSRCELVFFDDTFAVAGDASLAIGKELMLAFMKTTVFKGTITSLASEVSFEGGDSIVRTVITAECALHRLAGIANARTFQQVSDSDIATSLLGESGMQGMVDATAVVHEVMLQSGQTNLEFLLERGALLGYDLWSDPNGKVHFQKRPERPDAVAEFEHGTTLYSFRARKRMSSVSGVQAKGWSEKQKLGLVADKPLKATAHTTGILSRSRVIDVQAETDRMAVAMAAVEAAEIDAGEGSGVGAPALWAGKGVTLKGVGPLSGLFLVTSVVHEMNGEDGYRTTFRYGEPRPQARSDVRRPTPARENRGELAPVVGIVTANNDPENRGRVKVKFPTFPMHQGKDMESGWARLVTPMSGNGAGIQFLPEVNDEVVVLFEGGDLRHPYVIGAVWNGVDLPPGKTPELVAGGKVVKRLIVTTTGHRIELDDSTATPGIAIRDRTGKNVIVIDSKANTIRIASEGDLALSAKGAIRLEAVGDISMSAGGLVRIASLTGAELTAKANLRLKGAQVTINDDAIVVI